MHKYFLKSVFFLFAAVSGFSQAKLATGKETGLFNSEPFWRQALGGSVLSLPSVQAQSAVVALDGGNIRAYSTAGNPMWEYAARGKISPFVTRSREGTSYFSRTNGTLIAINRAGRELWQRNLGAPLSAKVIPGWDGRLFAPTDKKISCYTASGTLLWARVFEEPFSIAPKLDSDGGIIFLLENNEVCRLDPFGNMQKWTLSKKPTVLLPIEQMRILALYTDGNAEIVGEGPLWPAPDEKAPTGKTTDAKVPTPAPFLPSGFITAVCRWNNLAVVFSDGNVVLASLNEKKILWKGESHIKEFIKNGNRPDMEAEMLFDERGVYVLSKNGATGFTHDGRRLWYTLLQNAAAVPAFGDDGVLYSGGRDWILYAYKIEDRISLESGWLYGPQAQGAYGTGGPKTEYIPNVPYFEHEVKEKLEQIDRAIKTGRVGSNELEWTTFLMNATSQESLFQDRIKAFELIGQLGSHETIPWLANIFKKESDPHIRAAAAEAIGAIGVDPQGIAINTFLNSIIQGGGTAIKDDQILAAIVMATGALCRFSGPPLSETGIRILTLLTGKTQPVKITRLANKELATLR